MSPPAPPDNDAPTPAVPAPSGCVSYKPRSRNTLVVGQKEFVPPAGVTVVNWWKRDDPNDQNVADVAQKVRAGTSGRPDCRSPSDLSELIIHETVSSTINRGNPGPPNVQMVLHRDGTFTQHADLAADLNHANHHNKTSFGFETVNPVIPRATGATAGTLPDLNEFPCLLNTTWANRDKPNDGKPPRNPDRHYVLPTDAQLEAATRLIAWATDTSAGHGMAVPLIWTGQRAGRFLFGRDDVLFAGPTPGVSAHGYSHHSDGYLIALYSWLRLHLGLGAKAARNTTFDIAATKVARHRHPGGSNTMHADLSHLL